MKLIFLFFQVKLTRLENFGDKVLNFFKSAIDRQYPERDKLTPLSSIKQGIVKC